MRDRRLSVLHHVNSRTDSRSNRGPHSRNNNPRPVLDLCLPALAMPMGVGGPSQTQQPNRVPMTPGVAQQQDGKTHPFLYPCQVLHQAISRLCLPRLREYEGIRVYVFLNNFVRNRSGQGIMRLMEFSEMLIEQIKNARELRI